MNKKSALSIHLTESVTFLHSSPGERVDEDAQPSVLRGLLTLTLSKPAKLTSIEIQLQGSSYMSWQSGVGAECVERTEQQVYSASNQLFQLEEPHSTKGWQDFPKGVYNYPISFAIPPSIPPSLECKFGYVRWKLKAWVHRYGKFAPKITCSHKIVLVPSPNVDLQDNRTVVLEQFWEARLQVGVAISGRNFYAGDHIPLLFTINPLEDNIAIQEISIWLEERTDYYTRMDRIARTEPLRRTQLSVLKGIPESKKDGTEPLFPVPSRDDGELKRSSFYAALLQRTQDPSQVPASFTGSGPWTFQYDAPLPETCSQVHFTNTNPAGNITIKHNLKIIVLAEDRKNPKGKLVEIVETARIHILSCRCNPKWMALPGYSEAVNGNSDTPRTCPCIAVSKNILQVSAASNGTTENSSLLATSIQFERLVSGREGSAGESPPSYDSIS